MCGHLVDPAMTLRVIDVESRGQTYAIHDNTSNQTFAPSSLPDAEAVASRLIVQGHRLDIGLMQINYDVWLKPGSFPLAKAFDACTNITIGSIILNADYVQALQTSKVTSEALWRALSLYNSGSDWRGLGYANRVLMGPSNSAPYRTDKGSSAERARVAPVTFSERP
jgi:type IV secretion system protein VirB1